MLLVSAATASAAPMSLYSAADAGQAWSGYTFAIGDLLADEQLASSAAWLATTPTAPGHPPTVVTRTRVNATTPVPEAPSPLAGALLIGLGALLVLMAMRIGRLGSNPLARA